MGKSIGFEFDSYMHEIFNMEEVDVRTYSPLTLAYIGDCVYDLIIKSLVIGNGNKQVNKMHKETSSLVQAATQSLMMRKLQDLLTDEERAVYKRGRNAKSPTVPKNADVGEYRRATGFEALVGYLYLTGDRERLEFIMKAAFEAALDN